MTRLALAVVLRVAHQPAGPHDFPAVVALVDVGTRSG